MYTMSDRIIPYATQDKCEGFQVCVSTAGQYVALYNSSGSREYLEAAHSYIFDSVTD